MGNPHVGGRGGHGTPLRKLQLFLCRGKEWSWDACAKKLDSAQYYTGAGFQRVCTNKQRDNHPFIQSAVASLTGERPPPLPPVES